ncbi:dihydrodipicolinate synthase family protein [Negadavirga shengliensis]|uniref:Dihydrodipicolinate synthase family protein n=1 Tax=Negadavirga shengliensis TaxID=1389218 RepID=A0ABV9T914_9BACT
MTQRTFIRPLQGIIPPMITPLLGENELDIPGIENMVSHLLRGGVHGIFVLGTTGECTNISYGLRRDLIRKTCEMVQGRVPVLVGITDTSVEESISLAQAAQAAGADAVVAAPPYYFGLGQPELEVYFRRLADALPLPLFLYNMPSHTKTMISQEVVMKLSEHDNIYGLKDSSANAVYFNSMVYALRNRSDFSLLVGPEEMMAASVLMGGHGGVSGGANMFPGLYVDLYQAAKDRDMEKVLELQEMAMEISANIYNLGTYGSSYLKGLKAAVSSLGLCDGYVASPMESFPDDQKRMIAQKVRSLKAFKFYGAGAKNINPEYFK